MQYNVGDIVKVNPVHRHTWYSHWGDIDGTFIVKSIHSSLVKVEGVGFKVDDGGFGKDWFVPITATYLSDSGHPKKQTPPDEQLIRILPEVFGRKFRGRR